MLIRSTSTGIPWRVLILSCIALLVFSCSISITNAQDYDDGGDDAPAAPPPEQGKCDGIFLTYNFMGREKIYPLVKNTTVQAWSFKAMASVLNAGTYELKSWMMSIGFHHDELIVSADGAVIVNAEGDDFPYKTTKNGTVFAGFPQTDLETAIDTAGDYTQMMAQVNIKGTLFGVKPTVTPMPTSLKLVNDGYKCPAATKKASYMHVCCKRDPNFKIKKVKTKFLPRQYGDLSFTYDILQAYENKYMAQVTIDNNHPLGRLDQWNLTWEWMRNEFIYNMKGAYTHRKDPSDCIYGPQGQYYQDFDFSTVMNCQKKPIISDLPPELANDDKVGKLPYCCKNGTLLPTTMNETKARAIFQLEVFKLPPDMNRTALYPPQNWKIQGLLNPTYSCGPPLRVDPTEFPDPLGIDATTSAVASWQVTCNITSPKPKHAKCCVSFSAYYAESVVPCNTCACGCDEDEHCSPNAPALPLPPDALLVPFANRTIKAKAWAGIKHHKVPRKLPCPDNCGVSINWHLDTDYKSGWTARITLFNWDDFPFVDWFTAFQFKKAFPGYEKVYSFNGTKLTRPKNTIFMEGLPGLNYLVGEVNGTHPERDPRIPGKQQSVISFLKKDTPHIKVSQGDGFPTKVYFNGEECALPKQLPMRSGAVRPSSMTMFPAILLSAVTFVLLSSRVN